MKTHLQALILTMSSAAFLFAAEALAQTPSSTASPKMKAIVVHEFGGPEVLRLEEIDKPVPKDNQILVKVRALSVNPLDWHFMEGIPYLARPLAMGFLKPSMTQLGVDYSGTVEAVGKDVTEFKPGDEVYGNKFGAFAEYVVATDKAMIPKPANLTFEEAASLPVAAMTALQALRDSAKIQAGQKVLINGASGGVGTFAVQIAKAFGAEVTGVCSGRNVELVRSLGADHVIDYTKEDFTKAAERYDVIIDNVGNQPLSRFRAVLTPNGKYVAVGGGGVTDNRWTGPLITVMKMLLLKPVSSQDMKMMLAEMNKKDPVFLADLMQTGKLKPIIDKTYTFNQFPEAMRYLEEGHARGKVVLTVPDNIGPLAPVTTSPVASKSNPGFIAFVLISIPLLVLIGPIVLAIILNRRFKAHHPSARGFRWGYYFSIISVIAGLVLGIFLEAGMTAFIICGLIYAVLAWFFAQRHRWAWVALTIASFNPIAWIINAIYLWKRWTEPAVAP